MRNHRLRAHIASTETWNPSLTHSCTPRTFHTKQHRFSVSVSLQPLAHFRHVPAGTPTRPRPAYAVSRQHGPSRFAASANRSASAFVNRMGTILPLASPLSSFGLPGFNVVFAPSEKHNLHIILS